jgi:hypothetical protein
MFLVIYYIGRCVLSVYTIITNLISGILTIMFINLFGFISP